MRAADVNPWRVLRRSVLRAVLLAAALGAVVPAGAAEARTNTGFPVCQPKPLK